jgi:hypothetical protein
MANYCFTKYWVEGDRNILKRLADLIGAGRYVTDILPKLGMPMSNLTFQEEGCPFWHGAKLIGNALRFTEEAKWEQSTCLWKLQEMENSGLGDIRFYSVVSESDLYHTNDGEGKYFPYRILVFCSEIPDTEPPHFYVVSDDNTFLFRTEEEMYAFFEEKAGWKAQSREELRVEAEKAGQYLYVSDIEVVPGPTHIGISKMQFEFEKMEDGHINVTIRNWDPKEIEKNIGKK